MKKILMALAAVLCCAMTTTLFTACGGDDDDPTPQREIVAYSINYSLNFPEKEDANTGNLYALCTKIEVGYPDASGTEQREEVKGGTWSKMVTYTKIVDGYLKLYLTAPESIDPATLTYDRYVTLVQATPDRPTDISVILNDDTKIPGSPTNFKIFNDNIKAYFPKSKALSGLKVLCAEPQTIVSVTFSK